MTNNERQARLSEAQARQLPVWRERLRYGDQEIPGSEVFDETMLPDGEWWLDETWGSGVDVVA